MKTAAIISHRTFIAKLSKIAADRSIPIVTFDTEVRPILSFDQYAPEVNRSTNEVIFYVATPITGKSDGPMTRLTTLPSSGIHPLARILTLTMVSDGVALQRRVPTGVVISSSTGPTPWLLTKCAARVDLLYPFYSDNRPTIPFLVTSFADSI